MTFSTEELEHLTEEERAGMLEEVDEQVPADPIEPEGEGTDTHTAEQDAADADDGDEQEAKDDGEQEDGEPAEQPEAPVVDEPKPEPKQLFQVDVPADLEQQISSIDDQKLALAEEYDEGLISYKERQAKINALDAEQHQLRRLQDTVELQSRHEAAQAQQQYNDTCAAFIAQNQLGQPGEPRFDAFNAYLVGFQQNEANQTLPLQAQLDTAYQQWATAMGIPVNKAPAARAGSKPIPQTLANVPAAEVEVTDNGRFAALDRMATRDPLKFEDTLAAMGDAEREAYLSS